MSIGYQSEKDTPAKNKAVFCHVVGGNLDTTPSGTRLQEPAACPPEWSQNGRLSGVFGRDMTTPMAWPTHTETASLGDSSRSEFSGQVQSFHAHHLAF